MAAFTIGAHCEHRASSALVVFVEVTLQDRR